MEASVTWLQEMAFEAEADGHRFHIDANAELGGHDLGPRPKTLLLNALAGCTAMDVISILQKMRLNVTGLKVSADGAISDEHPRRFTRVVLRYDVTGQDLPPDRVKRAVELSQERYCGVSATLRPTVELLSEIYVNGEPLAG